MLQVVCMNFPWSHSISTPNYLFCVALTPLTLPHNQSVGTAHHLICIHWASRRHLSQSQSHPGICLFFFFFPSPSLSFLRFLAFPSFGLYPRSNRTEGRVGGIVEHRNLLLFLFLAKWGGAILCSFFLRFRDYKREFVKRHNDECCKWCKFNKTVSNSGHPLLVTILSC